MLPAIELKATGVFYNAFKDQDKPVLIIGNGPSLAEIPDSFLKKYDSFGSNLIYKREDFTPTYYATVDSRVMREFQDEVMEAFSDIPKFLPTPNLDKWQGPNIYRFYHRPGPLWPHPLAGALYPRELMEEKGITYVTVTNVLMQIAFYMGFRTMLCVGLDNTPKRGHHFYEGDDWKGQPDMETWSNSYGTLLHGFRFADPSTSILNLSTYTEVTSLPQEDWEQWA